MRVLNIADTPPIFEPSAISFPVREDTAMVKTIKRPNKCIFIPKIK